MKKIFDLLTKKNRQQKSWTQEIGYKQEDRAWNYLSEKNWILREKNFRTRWGEIDLICENVENDIVFVEVKYRTSQNFGGGLSAVHQRKQERLMLTALHYIKLNQLQNRNFRFDVIALSPQTLEHIENAFSANRFTL